MQSNLYYLEVSRSCPEPLSDTYYAKGKVVIPQTCGEDNALTVACVKLNELITAFHVLFSMQKDTSVLVAQIINILNTTPHINYHPFVQFFMVHNQTFSLFKSYSAVQQRQVVFEMLVRYDAERYALYQNHGYTHMILQVMSDNYSHKRNSKTTIEKIVSMLLPYKLQRIKKNATDEELLSREDYYFLPDKGDNNSFERLVNLLQIRMPFREQEHNKFPDIVFKHDGHYYVCELKTMKEDGGGQNKTMVEASSFISSEEDGNIHYMTFLDANYANKIFCDNSPKVQSQRMSIENALKACPKNYFLNTAGMEEFLKDLFV